MAFKGLQHCGLIVSDLEKSRWFYGTVLGMKEVPRPLNFKFDGAWFEGGGDHLHLIIAGDTTSPPGFKDPGKALRTGLATHIAFELDSLDEMLARLREHHIEVLLGPIERGDGIEQMYVHDPDNYMIEFFCYTGQEQPDAPERRPIRD